MTLDEDTRAFIERASVNPPPAPDIIPLEAFREAAAALQPLGYAQEDVAEIRDATAPKPDGGTVPVRVYAPAVDGKRPLLVCAHGGTWVRMTVDLMDEYYRFLANRSGCVLVAVDFALAPEAQFPAQIHEIHAAARWAVENAEDLGGDARVGIYGESSGGNLAAAAALFAREQGDVSYDLQVLMLPLLDARCESESWGELGADYLLTKDQIEFGIQNYAPDVNRTDPLLSPVCAEDLGDLPTALIVTGEYDPLRADGERYAAALEAAGVRVRHERLPGLIHHAMLVPKAIPRGQEAAEELAQLIAKAFAATPA